VGALPIRPIAAPKPSRSSARSVALAVVRKTPRASAACLHDLPLGDDELQGMR
jgi:hypothetical protein